MLSAALFSQSKNSGCSIVQPSPCIASNNVLNKLYARATARNQDLNRLGVQNIGYRKKNTPKNRLLTFRSRAYYVSPRQKVETLQYSSYRDEILFKQSYYFLGQLYPLLNYALGYALSPNCQIPGLEHSFTRFLNFQLLSSKAQLEAKFANKLC